MIKWSILILSVPNRLNQLQNLYKNLQSQIDKLNLNKHIEVLTLVDNKNLSIGAKRNKILSLVSGQYCSFLDDDDNVSEDFISEIWNVISSDSKPDVICFDQDCNVNNKKFQVNFSLTNENQPAIMDATGNYPLVITRKPYHMCVWKSVIAKNTMFPDSSYGEDLGWLSQLWQRVKTQVKINKVLHFYEYSDQSSESIKRVKNG